ncbi:hypothetical protein AB5I41_20450 [Sphingomonas sp. MMS24-JH45]
MAIGARRRHEVDAIRAIARRHRMLPAVIVAQALERALARGEHGPLVHGWLCDAPGGGGLRAAGRGRLRPSPPPVRSAGGLEPPGYNSWTH